MLFPHYINPALPFQEPGAVPSRFSHQPQRRAAGEADASGIIAPAQEFAVYFIF